MNPDEVRRHAERWAEVAIADHVRSRAALLDSGLMSLEKEFAIALLRDLADEIEASKWRSREMQSIVDEGERRGT